MNFLDRLIYYFSPISAARRQAARRTLTLLSERKYDGASNSARLKLWNPQDTSANDEVKGAASSLRARARELRRNNAYAHRGIQVITTNVVGSGIKPVFKIKNKQLLKYFDREWKKWAEGTATADYEGVNNLLGLQALVLDAVAESGEAFVLRKRQLSGQSVPLKLQVLEADFLDNSHNEDLSGGRKIRQGIEFDSNNQRVAYHFYERHPGDTGGNIQAANRRFQKVRVSAEKVIHVFEKKRPGQIRGVSWLHPVMIRLRDLDTFIDATLKKQEVAACYAAFVYNATGDSLENTYSSKSSWELLEKLDAGTIEELPPGYDIKFSNPPDTGAFNEFVKVQLRSIAAGLGVTYEELTQDYSNVNFSSGRMGFLSFHRNIKRWQNDIMITQLLNPVFDWFVDAIQFAPGARNFNVNPDNIEVFWTRPAREMIDPAKEVKGNVDAVKAGFKTVSSVIRSMGDNPDEVFAERSEELKELKALEIPTESDPAQGKTNQQQTTEATPNATSGDPENTDED